MRPARKSEILILLYVLNYLTKYSAINMKSLSGVAETDFPAISASSLNILKNYIIKKYLKILEFKPG